VEEKEEEEEEEEVIGSVFFSKQENEVESRGKAGRECEEEGKGEERMKVILRGLLIE